MGLNATQSMAITIFQGLKNSSTSGDDSSEAMADIDESINVLNVMARASGNIELQEDLFPVSPRFLLLLMNVKKLVTSAWSWKQLYKYMLYSNFFDKL